MKILILTTSYPARPGDMSGLFVHHLARALARRGHALRVVVPGRSDAVGRREVNGIPVCYFRYALTRKGHRPTSIEGGIPEALRRYRTAAFQVASLMTSFIVSAAAHMAWADVVYVNWLGAGVAGAIAHLFRRVPMVITLRGDDAYWIRQKPLWRAAARHVFTQCEAVTVVSANMVELIEAFVPVRVRPVLVPTFGVDVERFKPRDCGVSAGPRGDVSGLFVGNVSRAKGVEVMLRALAGCTESWHHFALVGHGPDMEFMKKLACDLGIDDRLEWTGRRSAREIPDTMRRFDFLVLPSFSEGRPNVVMEAMASGLPVIATTVGGIPDIIISGETGILVKPGDDDELAGAISRLCGDPALRQSMSRQSREYIQSEDLTWDRTAREFEGIFQQVTRRRV